MPRRARRRLAAWAVTALLLAGIVAILWAAWTGWNALRSSPSVAPHLGAPVVVPPEYRAVVQEAAHRCPAVPARILAAQISAESGWDAHAQSGAGAQGIAQFMPRVWRQYGIDADGDGRADVWSPVDAIHTAAKLNCLNRKLVRDVPGDRLRNTLAAYNAGYAAVVKYDGVPPFPETQDYVDRVMDIAATIVL